MPTSARKSGLRGIVKKYIPYRGDNPDFGKKTGIPVQRVDIGSDGFEPFEDVLKHSMGYTPPILMPKKINHTQRPSNSSREYVQDGGPHPSTLSEQTRHRKLTSEDKAGDYGYEGGAYMDQSGFDDYSGPHKGSSEKRTHRQQNLSRIEDEQEEEKDAQEDEEEQEPTPKAKAKSRQQKGKYKEERPRELSKEPDQESEGEDTQGLKDIELGLDSDDPSEEIREPPVKKSKPEGEKRKAGWKTQSQLKKENKRTAALCSCSTDLMLC